jgi:exodeoxyribonuclease V alpha subunit
MFNLAIDSKLRGCDVVALKVEDIAPNGYALVHATTAHRINQGSTPDLSPPGTDSDFYFVQAEEPEAAVARIIELVKTRIPRRFRLDPVRDIQVLCLMNRGGVGARALNLELQVAMNPAGERKVERFGWTFAPGEHHEGGPCPRG